MHECSPYRGLHARRESLGVVPRSRANFCRPRAHQSDSRFPHRCTLYAGTPLNGCSSRACPFFAEGFSALADLLCEFERLLDHSQFVFVPGPGDPSPSPALPKPPLPKTLTKALRQKVPTAVFSSNPCRWASHATSDAMRFEEDFLCNSESAPSYMSIAELMYPKTLAGLISLYTNPVSIIRVPIQTVP
jgi:hypothetical protein